MSRAARALSAPVRGADAPVNAITDAMNATVPWLWWPLIVPSARAPLPPEAHALYVVHAVVLRRLGRAAGIRLGAWAATGLAFAGWALFTGAWDRRAVAARTPAV